ncbi:MAG: helix-turn-helix transcriptional regulator [Candidatus Binatia bacterium]
MAPDTTSARDRVLFQLKTRGPQTAAALAGRLGVTPMAVRQHLQALEPDGLVTYTDERRKVGRPARLWNLTPAAASRFPDAHADLTVDLLKAVRSTFGEEGLDRLVTERSRQQRTAYLARMPADGAPLEERLAALAAIRSDEGYMSEWSRQDDGSWLLVENHCPICAAATVCQGLCRDELSLFRELLGDRVSVNRGEHILAGARRCAYRIEPAGGASSAPPSDAASAKRQATGRRGEIG